jgi:hypothetical protein
VYYNPARLLHQEAPSFVAIAKLYEWTTYRVQDGLGDGRDLEQSRFGGAPGFLVGTFTLPFLEGHQFAYGIMTRSRANIGYALREEEEGELVPTLPGDEALVGLIDLQTNFKDDWMGVSWARELGNSLSIGASIFYYERSFSRTASTDLRVINENLEIQAFEEERTYSTRDKGLVGKAGVAWRSESWSAGVTTTLPRWALSTSGTIRYEDFGVGLIDPSGAPIDNVLVSSVQGGLPMEWKTPWSFGAGAGWNRGDWFVHAAAEYFTAVPAHVLVEGAPDETGQSTGDPIEYTVIEERDAVLNGGVGAKWIASDDVSAFFSVVSNRSAAPDSVTTFTESAEVTNHTSQQMDFVLVGGGVSFRTRWADLTIGATWQGSSEPVARLGSPPTVPEPEDPALFKIDEWRFLFGFSIPFVDERLGGIGGS